MKLTSYINDFIKTYFSSRIYFRFFIGFTCGIPFLLRLSVLDLWLKESGASNTAIGFFTLINLPFTLKFLWAPFVEKINFPILSAIFGQRRGWAIASQILLFLGLSGMASINPQTDTISLIFYTSMVALADGWQDMSMYAYQLDNTKVEMLGPMAGIFVFGYKSGMFFSKSITLYFAHYFGWNCAYASMALSVFLCTLFIFFVKEPKIENSSGIGFIKRRMIHYKKQDKSRFKFVWTIKAILYEYLIFPFNIFIKKENWIQVVSIIISYRIGDRVIQKMSKLFYVDLGVSILEIANVVQVFGTAATLFGGIIGGYISKRIGIIKSMFYIGIIHAISCYAYIFLLCIGYSTKMLYLTVFIENITCGATATAFIAFLYNLCNRHYAATTQYALLWSFCEVGGIIARTFSGIIADALGWFNFFLFVPIIFIPSLIILYGLKKQNFMILNNMNV
jgi:PAT family beta-lactamase induction signal transducer AmpG